MPAPPLESRIEGRPDGPTLVFVHGWPDDASLWREQVDALGDAFRCVSVTLPNFGEQPVLRGGCDFPQLVDRLLATLDAVRRGDESVVLVSHDWGAVLGYLAERSHPERIRAMVAMDVGGHLQPGPRETAMIVAYQWTLVACWLIGGLIPPLGDALTRGCARLLGVPGERVPGVRSRMNYPYFWYWRGKLLGGRRGARLEGYAPSCPVLYLYGTRKPFQFHSERWLELVSASGGRGEALDAGHWFMLSRAQQVNNLIREWLGAVEASGHR